MKIDNKAFLSEVGNISLKKTQSRVDVEFIKKGLQDLGNEYLFLGTWYVAGSDGDMSDKMVNLFFDEVEKREFDLNESEVRAVLSRLVSTNKIKTAQEIFLKYKPPHDPGFLTLLVDGVKNDKTPEQKDKRLNLLENVLDALGGEIGREKFEALIDAIEHSWGGGVKLLAEHMDSEQRYDAIRYLLNQPVGLIKSQFENVLINWRRDDYKIIECIIISNNINHSDKIKKIGLILDYMQRNIEKIENIYDGTDICAVMDIWIDVHVPIDNNGLKVYNYFLNGLKSIQTKKIMQNELKTENKTKRYKKI